jgi:hypothetical protein
MARMSEVHGAGWVSGGRDDSGTSTEGCHGGGGGGPGGFGGTGHPARTKPLAVDAVWAVGTLVVAGSVVVGAPIVGEPVVVGVSVVGAAVVGGSVVGMAAVDAGAVVGGSAAVARCPGVETVWATATVTPAVASRPMATNPPTILRTPDILVTGGGDTRCMSTPIQDRLPFAGGTPWDEDDWRIDREMREVGRQGIAEARAALAAAVKRAERRDELARRQEAA